MKKLFALLACACVTALASTSTVSAWSWPVQGPVVRAFALGDDPYAAGQHRGIDVAAGVGGSVHAPSGGLVSFRGFVPSGGLTLTIETNEGYSVTLQQLADISVVKGALVLEGAIVGTVGASVDAVTTRSHVHLGVRVSADRHGYLDPLTLLAEPGRSAGASDTLRPSAGAGTSDEVSSSLDREVESQRDETRIPRTGEEAADELPQASALEAKELSPAVSRSASRRAAPENLEETHSGGVSSPAPPPPVEEQEGSSTHPTSEPPPLADAPLSTDVTVVDEAIDSPPASDTADRETIQGEGAASSAGERVVEHIEAAASPGVSGSTSGPAETSPQIIGQAESLPLGIEAPVGSSAEAAPPSVIPGSDASRAATAPAQDTEMADRPANDPSEGRILAPERSLADPAPKARSSAAGTEETSLKEESSLRSEAHLVIGQVAATTVHESLMPAGKTARVDASPPRVDLSGHAVAAGTRVRPVMESTPASLVVGMVATSAAEQHSEIDTRMRSWGLRLIAGGLATSLILLVFAVLVRVRRPRSVQPAVRPNERHPAFVGMKDWRPPSRERCSRRGMSHGHARRSRIAGSMHTKAPGWSSRPAAPVRARHRGGRRRAWGRTL